MSRLWKSIGAGALGGLFASYAMNKYSDAISATSRAITGQPSLNQDEDATVKTAQAISRLAFHHELTDSEKRWAAPAVHYSMGVGFGAVYGFLAEKVPATAAGLGLPYGTAVWIGADEVAVPAMGFAKGPAETSLSAHLNALASHLVYGVVTAATRKLMLRAD